MQAIKVNPLSSRFPDCTHQTPDARPETPLKQSPGCAYYQSRAQHTFPVIVVPCSPPPEPRAHRKSMEINSAHRDIPKPPTPGATGPTIPTLSSPPTPIGPSPPRNGARTTQLYFNALTLRYGSHGQHTGFFSILFPFAHASSPPARLQKSHLPLQEKLPSEHPLAIRTVGNVHHDGACPVGEFGREHEIGTFGAGRRGEAGWGR